MYRDISSPVPVLNHNASKNKKLVTHWYKDITVTSLSGETMILFRQSIIHKGIWYTQAFSSQLLRGCNKNQFFNFFGLLHDMLRRQDLLNNWLERRLKLSAMFLSIFRKVVSPSWFYCSNSQGNFEMTLEIFGYQ